MVAVCIAVLFLLGLGCLVWPRGMQSVAMWWADLGMTTFPGLIRSPQYIWLLRFLGVLLLGLVGFLLSSLIRV